MPLLPSGLVVPPLPYVIAVVVAAATVASFLVSLAPRVEQQHVFAFTPWMAVGASAHVFYQLEPAVDVYPAWAEPLFGAPMVYLTTFVALGAVWTFLAFGSSVNPDENDNVALFLGLAGTAVLLGLLGVAAWREAFVGVEPFWSAAALVITVPVTIGVYFTIAYTATGVVARAKLLGGLVIFAHALDGITTAVGIDILETSERSPLPRTIMDLAGQLPVAETIGVGWLFVLVKLAIAVIVVVAFADYLESDPVRGNLAFAAIIALGLGPAVNNLLLFALRDSAALATVAS
ncbi:DUF63 family protein [Halapricum salinum]|uniref:DUF63 family protein n=1 Tax=Halapricum salinum TaxID=1457250 RepID=A0A4D6HC63_9EURY|nr:DUF63 family protein [Halapricum salinum]QCC51583.1 DUF63 family protein [Halapricum salinum]